MFRHVTTRFAGLIILIAGLWGGLVPFVGPYFHFALGPNHSWTWTSGRFYLSVLPAIAAVAGGLMLLASGPRFSGRIGALLALAGGVWFAIGPDVSLLWHAGGAQGVGHGHKVTRMLELLTYHTGLGVLIATFAAYALPGVAVVTRTAAATEAGTGAATAPVGRRRFGLFGRRRAVSADRGATPAGEPVTRSGVTPGLGAQQTTREAGAPPREVAPQR
jgi:hypothetical protein